MRKGLPSVQPCQRGTPRESPDRGLDHMKSTEPAPIYDPVPRRAAGSPARIVGAVKGIDAHQTVVELS